MTQNDDNRVVCLMYFTSSSSKLKLHVYDWWHGKLKWHFITAHKIGTKLIYEYIALHQNDISTTYIKSDRDSHKKMINLQNFQHLMYSRRGHFYKPSGKIISLARSTSTQKLISLKARNLTPIARPHNYTRFLVPTNRIHIGNRKSLQICF